MLISVLLIASMMGCGSTNSQTKQIFEEDDLRGLSISLDEAFELVEDVGTVICLKREGQLYALDTLPLGYSKPEYGIKMFTHDFMYNGTTRYYTYKDHDPAKVVKLLTDNKIILGDAPIPTRREGDTLVLVHVTDERATSIVDATECSKLFPSLRMYYYAATLDSWPDYSYLLLYNYETDEVVCLSAAEAKTIQVSDSEGNIHDRCAVNDSRFVWNFEGLEFGESYTVSWQGKDGMQNVKMIADSWQCGEASNSKSSNKQLKQLGTSETGRIEEYDISKLQSGTFIISINGGRSIIINCN